MENILSKTNNETILLPGILDATENNDGLYDENIAERRLVLNQDISESVLNDYIMYILKWNREDKHLPTDKRKPIYLFINSAGGDVMAGFSLVDTILASNTPVKAVGVGLVASMAYYIFMACTVRYSFANTIFLMHDGAVNIQNSASKSKDTMSFFNNLDDRIKNFVLTHSNITDEEYDSVYAKEYYMFAEEAQKLGCVDKIIDVDCDMDEIL